VGQEVQRCLVARTSYMCIQKEKIKRSICMISCISTYVTPPQPPAPRTSPCAPRAFRTPTQLASIHNRMRTPHTHTTCSTQRHKHTQRDRERDRERDRQTETHTHTRTRTHTHTRTHTRTHTLDAKLNCQPHTLKPASKPECIWIMC